MYDTHASVDAVFQSGRQAWLRNDVTSAVELLQQAHGLEPNNGPIAYALGCALLKSGDLQGGYPLLNSWRERAARVPRLPIPAYEGQSLAAKHLLIWGEDGFGDQIMYARFAVAFIEQGAKVSWFCPRPLVRLFRHMGIEALPNDESFTLTGIDYYCGSSSLPEAVGLTLSSIPSHPFVERPSAQPSHGVGLMTFASIDHKDGPERTLPAAEAARLLAMHGAVNLDPAETGAADFLDTATLIAGLRAVVTVDTAVAHLAGAMGIPTTILLPHVADWKWFDGRSDSPWYESVQLVRQPTPDNWKAVVDCLLER